MTPIQRFLSGKTLLITGATGFLAKGLIQKLLRDVPGLRRIYLLIRPGQDAVDPMASARERLRSGILGSNALARARHELGEQFDDIVARKLFPVPGDLTHDRMGIPPEIHDRLTDEVDIVVNCAATVVFDERIDVALDLNTLGPRRVVEFTKACRDAVLLHVSTAYVGGSQTGLVKESLLSAEDVVSDDRGNGRRRTFDLDEEIRAIQRLAENTEKVSWRPSVQGRFRRVLDKRNRGKHITESRVSHQMEGLRGRWVGERLVEEGLHRARRRGWHDNYTFTKALGELVVAKERGDLPVAIVRPSIIESSLSDPEPGWIDGLKVADPLIAAYGKGRLPDFPAKPSVVLDLIPVDLVVNAIIGILPTIRESDEIDVFHVATGSENPLTLGRTLHLVRGHFQRHPIHDRDGKIVPLPVWNWHSPRKFRRLQRLKYQLPLTTLRRVMEATPLLPWSPHWRSRTNSRETMVGRLLSLTEIYSPYTNLACRFDTSRTRRVFESLDPGDRELFNMDVSKIDWDDYIPEVHIPGLKRHVVKTLGRPAVPPAAPGTVASRPAQDG